MKNRVLNVMMQCVLLSILMGIYCHTAIAKKTIRVPGDQPTIQAGIDFALNGDDVLIADGQYNITTPLDFKGKAITVKSETSPLSCVINCQSQRCVWFHNNETKSSILMNITLENGLAQDDGNGGGIYFENSSPLIFFCIIKENETPPIGNGAGIYCKNSSPIFSRVIIAKNTAGQHGGGVYADATSYPVFEYCDIFDNDAGQFGGGIYLVSSSSPDISRIFIFKNHALKGGGIYIQKSNSSSIKRCLIRENTAENEGGGIYIEDTSNPIIENCIIAENKAVSNSGNGNGLYISNCRNPIISNCTFGRNQSLDANGGAIYSDLSNPTLTNCILWQNGNKEMIITNGNPTVRYSCIYNDTQWNNTGDNNINSDPLFRNYQDPPKNTYDNENTTYYALNMDSPCVNTGTKLFQVPEIDLFGYNRTLQGITFDMGAREYFIAKSVYLETDPEPPMGRDPFHVTFRCDILPDDLFPLNAYLYVLSVDNGKRFTKTEGVFTTTDTEFGAFPGGLYKAQCLAFVGPDQSKIFSASEPVYVKVSSFNWSYQSGDVIRSSPAIGSDGSIYFGSENGVIFGISSISSTKWHYHTGSRVTASPAVYTDGTSETLYIGAENHYFYAIDTENGNVKWIFPTRGPIYGSAAVDPEGNIYFGSCDKTVYALNPNNRLLWGLTTGDRIHSSPSYVHYQESDEKIIYIGSLDQHLYAINAKTGHVLWKFYTGGEIYSSPAIGSDGTIYIATCNISGPLNENKLFAVNRDGSKQWSFELGRGAFASPVVYNGMQENIPICTIYIGTYENKLFAINMDGSEKWVFPSTYSNQILAGDFNSTPVIGNAGTIYIGAENGRVFAIRYDDGKELWNYDTGDAIESSPVINYDGSLIVGSQNHLLHSIQTNSYGISNNSPWPLFRGNMARTAAVSYSETMLYPTVTHVYPGANETNIPANTIITFQIDFSKRMKESTLEISLYNSTTDEDVPIKINPIQNLPIEEPKTSRASFEALTVLEYDTEYEVSVNFSASDINNNEMLSDWTWSFFTQSKNPKIEPENEGMRGCVIHVCKDSLTNTIIKVIGGITILLLIGVFWSRKQQTFCDR